MHSSQTMIMRASAWHEQLRKLYSLASIQTLPDCAAHSAHSLHIMPRCMARSDSH